MCFKHVLELVNLNAIPSQQFSISAKESRPMVHPVKLWKSFSAINAILVAIPSHQHAAD
jgi:translation initiation factor 2B subunit (eIF-2B alpha/beta/delta family)